MKYITIPQRKVAQLTEGERPSGGVGRFPTPQIFIFLFTFLVVCTGVNAVSPVGVEIVDGFVHTWNGAAVPDTYYNKSGGLLQYANDVSRTRDVTYVYGGAKNQSGKWFYFLISSWNGVIKNGTDSSSYFWLSSELNLSVDGGLALIKKNDSRSLNDEMVNMTLSLKLPSSKTGAFYYVTGLRNLDISSDGLYEPVGLVLGNGTRILMDNRTGSYWWENVTRIVIDGGGAGYGYDLRFPKGVMLWYNHTSRSTNGDFTFHEYIGNIAANTEYSFKYFWIDACATTCEDWCLIVNTNSTFGSFPQGKFFKSVQCSSTIDVSCGGCTWTGCTMEWRQNTTTGTTVITTTDRDRPLKCMSSSCAQANTNNAVKDLQASRIGDTEFFCAKQYTASDWRLSNAFGNTYPFTITKNDPITTVWTPPNNTVVSSPGSAVFGCNSTGNILPDNISVRLNNTYNYTGTANLSRNVSFELSCNFLIYTCSACYSHNCQYSTSGNFTMNFSGCVVSVPGDVGIVHYPVKKREFQSDNFFIWIAMIILGVSAYLLFGKKGEKK